MPIWFELMALSLAAYAVGLLIGWVLWGNIAQAQPDDEPAAAEQSAPGTSNSNTS